MVTTQEPEKESGAAAVAAEEVLAAEAAAAAVAAEAAAAEDEPDVEAITADNDRLRAIVAAFLPEGVDLDTELDRVGTTRGGELIYSPPSGAKPPVARQQTHAPRRRGGTPETPDVSKMSLPDRAKYARENLK